MTESVSNDQIFAHRGFSHPFGLGPNTELAFDQAFKSGFGIETDIRADGEGVWIAHDLNDLQIRLPAESVLKFGIPVALNIKTDGLIDFALKHIDRIRLSGTFFFDGSIPQMLLYRNNGIPHALRISEYETELPWKPDFIWLDSFESDWWIAKSLDFIDSDSGIVIVSPELHGRDPRYAWDAFVELSSRMDNRLYLCTDLPHDFIKWTI